jgi:putative drug exporter of the RND superfamily
MSVGPTLDVHAEPTGALARLARACARHPWRVIGAWIVVVVAVFAATASFGGTLVDEFTLPESGSKQAQDLLEQRFPARAGDAATVVFAGDVRTPTGRAAVDRALQGADRVAGVTSVGDPYAGRAGDVSRDGQVAYADVQFREQASEVDKSQVDDLKDGVNAALAGSPVHAEYTGAVIQNSEPPSTGVSEVLGLAAAILILLIALGTVVAMGVPIVMALISVAIGIALIYLAASVTTFNTVTPTLAVMLGLGVGIDYSLFILTRHRQALHDGRRPEDAAALAAATAGRAVIFAGLTVAISISSLAIVGLSFITKLGLGAAITVVTAVAVAVTLLPAVLRLLGPRIDRLRVPGLRARDDSEAAREGSFSGRWGRFVTRHAWPAAIIGIAVMLVLALPALGARLGSSDAGTNPESTTTRKAYDLLASGFGAGFNGPLLVAVSGDRADANRVAVAVRQTPGVASVPAPTMNPDGDTAVVTAYPTTSPQSAQTSDLVRDLRDRALPRALAGSEASAYVGGPTAAFDDIGEHIASRLPWFLLAVVGITLLLITMAFRSVVVAIKAGLSTALSALAAYGVVVAVFQHGWGSAIVGLDRTGPIETFLPVIVFAILFGLSMDYEVFLMSRIREKLVGGDSARAAVRHGVAAIGRVIMAAALIMGVVFLSFILGDERTIKEFGLSLGVAILLDAFVVRLVIVPAVMHLLGDRAWWIPRWLDRALPRLTIEPPTREPAPARAPTGEPVAEGGTG